MGTDVAKQKTYEDKLRDRIRESVGELMTDEDLKKLIERGVEGFLFEERRVSGRYNDYIPPLMQEIVDSYLKERMEIEVKKWIKDNEDKFEKTIKEIFDRDAGRAFASAMSSVWVNPMQSLESELIRIFAEMGVNFNTIPYR